MGMAADNVDREVSFEVGSDGGYTTESEKGSEDWDGKGKFPPGVTALCVEL